MNLELAKSFNHPKTPFLCCFAAGEYGQAHVKLKSGDGEDDDEEEDDDDDFARDELVSKPLAGGMMCVLASIGKGKPDKKDEDASNATSAEGPRRNSFNGFDRDRRASFEPENGSGGWKVPSGLLS